MTLTVSELAAEAGVSADAIRYYERVGIVPPAERNEAGYRIFDRGSIERLRLIRGARRLGLRLDEIREVLEIRDRGLCPCGHTESLVKSRMAEVDAEMRRLREVRRDLARLIERYPAEECLNPAAAEWPCTQEFIRVGR